MAKFRIDTLDDLARQLTFSPCEVRVAQVAAAEELLHNLDPAKAYPVDFVIFRITGYHPREVEQSLLPGAALQHDLGLLIEAVSDSLDLCTAQIAQPVLGIDDVCERFNVTSKTIQRWRRKGLPARRFVFADGKRRVGFLLSSVERFVSIHESQVAQAANFSEIEQAELDTILRRARDLALDGGCCEREITRRIARRLHRSPLTILHIIRKHDQEHPQDAIFANVAPPLSPQQQATLLRRHDRGVGLFELSRQVERPASEIYRLLLDQRIDRLKRRKVRFIDDPLYHQPGAEKVVDCLAAQDELPASPSPQESRLPRDLPPYLADLYRVPLLTPARERALFIKFNFYKYQFAAARRRLDPELARRRDVERLEAMLDRATAVKNQIVRANLRLVVSVARKHLRPGLCLMELVSEGNITLMRAVEGFDSHKGHRFSTYATLALMKGFARAVPQMVLASRKASGDAAILAEIPDRRPLRDGLVCRDEVRHLLANLTPREREVVEAHFGLEDSAPTSDQLAQRLGLTSQRIRQIQKTAMLKLRLAAGVSE